MIQRHKGMPGEEQKEVRSIDGTRMSVFALVNNMMGMHMPKECHYS